MTQISCHPACLMFPEPTEEERDAMKADIAKRGLRNPITLYQGEILDGRTRMGIVEELQEHGISVTPEFRNYEGDDPYSEALSLNQSRRSTNGSQNACLAVLYWERVETGDAPFEPVTGRKTRDAIGDKFGVSGRYVDLARRLRNEAPPMFDAVHSGGSSLTQAQKDLGWVKDDEKTEPKVEPLPPEGESSDGVYFRKYTCPQCGYSNEEDQ